MDGISDRRYCQIKKSTSLRYKLMGDSESGNGFSFKMCWMWQTGDGAKKDG